MNRSVVRRRAIGSIRTATAFVLPLVLSLCGGDPVTSASLESVTSVAVSPTSAVLVSLGDTVQFEAAPTNNVGATLATTVVWTVDDPAIAGIDTNGQLIALANGSTLVRATAGGVSGEAALTVQQEAASVVTEGDFQAADAGTPLDSALAVTLFDARENPIEGATVSFDVITGSGTPDSPSATTDMNGRAATGWTLGVEAGIQKIAATSGSVESLFTAFAFPLVPDTIVILSGAVQKELTGRSLPEPLRAVVRDSLGNGVPDIPVLFTVVGEATLESDTVFTDLDGVASGILTLGPNPGWDTVFAAIPDSTVEAIINFPGSPVLFEAEATQFAFASAQGLTVGDTVTLLGGGFDADFSGMSVTIDGLAATILAGDQDRLEIEVPSFGCVPARTRTVEVVRDTLAGSAVATVSPTTVALPVGGKAVYGDPDDFCVQLPGGTDQEYLVGVTSTRWLDAVATFGLTAWDSIGAEPSPPAPAPPGPLAPVRASASPAPGQTPSTGGELALRAWEDSFFARLTTAPPSLVGSPATAPPMEGDVLDLRVPDLLADACLDYRPISAEVVFVGPRLAIASTVPVPGPLDPDIVPLLDALNTLSANFGATGIDILLSFLGLPADWDADSRITVVLTPEVGSMGVPAFASAVDQLPRTLCPSSDENRIVYIAVPDAATATQLSAVLDGAAPRLAHQISHITQWGRRLATGGSLLPGWLAEGQAEVATEATGMALAGLTAQTDLDASAFALPGGAEWLEGRFGDLSLFLGWDGAAGTVAGAPEGCSLFGFGGPQVPCNDAYAAGAAWSFVRFVSDRIGSGFVGGEPVFHRALLDFEPTTPPLEALEALTGVPLADLMVDWAAMLYTDGKLNATQAPDLQLASWDLNLIPDGVQRLTPADYSFADFTRLGSVVGGGTAYSLIGSAGSQGPLAIAIDDGVGGTITPDMAPRVWVVRMR